MPLTERDIVKLVLGVCIALLLGIGKGIDINIMEGWWLKGIAIGIGYVLFAIWKRRI